MKRVGRKKPRLLLNSGFLIIKNRGKEGGGWEKRERIDTLERGWARYGTEKEYEKRPL